MLRAWPRGPVVVDRLHQKVQLRVNGSVACAGISTQLRKNAQGTGCSAHAEIRTNRVTVEQTSEHVRMCPDAGSQTCDARHLLV